MHITQTGAMIFCSFVSAFSALLVCMLQNRYAEKRRKEEIANNHQLLEYKLSELTHKVEVHNNLIDRMYRVEEVQARQDEQIKTLFANANK